MIPIPMSDAQARQVFERFYRVDTARARRAGGGTGVGLGLAIVAAIVGAHHGTVHAGRAPKRGARFSVNLPAAGSTS